MPELPEVECTLRSLTSASTSGSIEASTITALNFHAPAIAPATASARRKAAPAPAPAPTNGHSTRLYALLGNKQRQRQLQKAITGTAIQRTARRGKYILFTLAPAHPGAASRASTGTLVLHLGMSGKLFLVGAAEAPRPDTRLVITLAPPVPSTASTSPPGGSRALHFCDTRMFGMFDFVFTADGSPPGLGLGIEPLSPQFTAEHLRIQMANSARSIKSVLLDQGIIAGLGNIYSDEALWRAKLHPRRPSGTLGNQQCTDLHQAIRTILTDAIACNGTNLEDGPSAFTLPYHPSLYQEHINVYARTGTPCSRCTAPICRERVAGRSAHYCPVCQPLAGNPTE